MNRTGRGQTKRAQAPPDGAALLCAEPDTLAHLSAAATPPIIDRPTAGEPPSHEFPVYCGTVSALVIAAFDSHYYYQFPGEFKHFHLLFPLSFIATIAVGAWAGGWLAAAIRCRRTGFAGLIFTLIILAAGTSTAVMIEFVLYPFECIIYSFPFLIYGQCPPFSLHTWGHLLVLHGVFDAIALALLALPYKAYHRIKRLQALY